MKYLETKFLQLIKSEHWDIHISLLVKEPKVLWMNGKTPDRLQYFLSKGQFGRLKEQMIKLANRWLETWWRLWCSILACERNVLCCEKISRRAFGYRVRSPMLVFHTCLWTRLWEWAWTPTAERVSEGWGNNGTRFTSEGWVVSFMDKTKVTVSALQNLSVRPLFWSIWPWLIHSSPEIKIYPLTLKTGYNYVAYILVVTEVVGRK